MLKSILVFLLAGFIYFNGNAQSTCGSSFSIEKDAENNSLSLDIETSGSYECTLSVFRDGEYEVIETKSSGLSNIVFEGLTKDEVYLVEVEFTSEQGLCRNRKIGGIKL